MQQSLHKMAPIGCGVDHCKHLVAGLTEAAVRRHCHEACSKIGKVEDGVVGVVHLENAFLMFTGIKP